ncbi:DUF1835 domain-containing protein [Gorillibacterium sp. sgz5001074]|uniref:DUF1835 domain-containing protein n=1 Tax=Gorillibacterium sp. sgz5001074 TaxID=3446695 RepID=UPI003F6817BD
MLHITNGDAVAERLRKAGMEGRVLPWREDYTEGPVAADMQSEAVRQERARFLDETFGIPPKLYEANREEQETALDAAVYAGEEIVLWFEHDLYDQTMQAYLLHRLSELEAQRDVPPLRLQLVTLGSYPGIEPFHGLGQLSPAQLASLYPGRRPVAPGQLALGRQAWEAYVSTDPRSVEALLPAPGTAALPFLRGAFAAHLARFPSVRDGLGRVERAVLEAVAASFGQLVPLFREATEPLTLYGIGDLAFWPHLERLRDGPHPLLRIDGAERLPRFGEPAPQGVTVRLTPDGRKVLDGEADAVQLNGIRRILGGVRLEPAGPVWRWDPDAERLVQPGN